MIFTYLNRISNALPSTSETATVVRRLTASEFEIPPKAEEAEYAPAELPAVAAWAVEEISEVVAELADSSAVRSLPAPPPLRRNSLKGPRNMTLNTGEPERRKYEIRTKSPKNLYKSSQTPLV